MIPSFTGAGCLEASLADQKYSNFYSLMNFDDLNLKKYRKSLVNVLVVTKTLEEISYISLLQKM